MIALLLGTALAVAALGFVLLPLFRDGAAALDSRSNPPTRDVGIDRARAVDALREIEFDRETGKLSDDDYASLKASYTQRALDAMRAEDAAATPSAPESADLDPAEIAVRRFRARMVSCTTCGPRPEPDAAYCSNCGSYLKGACAHCGAGIEEPGARFCGACGHALAA